MHPDPCGNVHISLESSDIRPEIKEWFECVDKDGSGRITSEELQAALVNAQRNCFSTKACQLMIKLFDRNKQGSIDIYEFQYLYTFINQWVNLFNTYDKDKSGYIEKDELMAALNQMGYRISQDFVNIFIAHNNKYDEQRRLNLDQFIVGCIKIQKITEGFKIKDRKMQGIITLTFEDFIRLILEDFL